jgi:membrane protease YdiL (CAAX protease family)
MKIKGIGLSLVLFTLLLVISWAFATTSLATIQRQYLQWNYFSHVIMVVLAITAIAIGKKDFRSFGFTLKRWRSDLRVALICLISAAGYIPSLVYPPIAENELINTLVIVAATLLTLVFVLREKAKNITTQPKLMVILLAPFSLSIASALNNAGFGTIASTVIFQFFFAGFGEEIFFRGYIQTRLNEDFGRPWSIKGVNFGPGLLITSALFGVLHLMNPFNPFMGEFELNLLWGISSFFFGLLFGFVREKTGSVLSACLAHGFVDLGQVVPLIF